MRLELTFWQSLHFTLLIDDGASSIVVLFRGNRNDASIRFVTIVLWNDTNSAKVGVCSGTRVVRLLYPCILGVSGEGDGGTIVLLFGPILIWAWVHVGVGHTQVFPDIGTNPVGWVLMVHRNLIRFVLAWAWHVEVLGSRVKLHSESELRLLLGWSINIIRVPRIREIKVTWDVVLRAWHSHELYLVSLLLLNIPDLRRKLSSVIDSRALSTLISHAEGSTLRNVSHMDRVMSTRTQVCCMLSLVTLLLRRLAEGPLWSLFRINRVMLARCWHTIWLISFPFWTTGERLGNATLL